MLRSSSGMAARRPIMSILLAFCGVPVRPLGQLARGSHRGTTSRSTLATMSPIRETEIRGAELRTITRKASHDLISRLLRVAVALALLVECAACSTSDAVSPEPVTRKLSISPKNAAVFELTQLEFEVWFDPSSPQSTWQCTLSDSAMGAVSTSIRGCAFTAAKGSHLASVSVRSGTLADSAHIVVYGTGAVR